MTELERLQVRMETLVEVHERAQHEYDINDLKGHLTHLKRQTRNKISRIKKGQQIRGYGSAILHP
jgi:predicted secreted Zn-dependent protease